VPAGQGKCIARTCSRSLMAGRRGAGRVAAPGPGGLLDPHSEIHAEDVRVGGRQLGETHVTVEADGSLVAVSYQEVHPAGTLITKTRKQCRDQPPPDPAPLHSRQQVDVQVGREPFGYRPGDAEVMMDVMERTALLS
jgi:hypothetical protein